MAAWPLATNEVASTAACCTQGRCPPPRGFAQSWGPPNPLGGGGGKAAQKRGKGGGAQPFTGLYGRRVV